MNRLTDEEIAELSRLHRAATPDPWYGDWDITNYLGDPIARTDVSLASDPSEANNDGPLIVAARNALPRLLGEILRLRKERDSWIECVWECLKAAGAPSNIDDVEVAFKAVGTKPSHFISSQFKKLLDEIDRLNRACNNLRDQLNYD